MVQGFAVALLPLLGVCPSLLVVGILLHLRFGLGIIRGLNVLLLGTFCASRENTGNQYCCGNHKGETRSSAVQQCKTKRASFTSPKMQPDSGKPQANTEV